MEFVLYYGMLFHFTPHIYTVGELLKDERSENKQFTFSCV